MADVAAGSRVAVVAPHVGAWIEIDTTVVSSN